MSEDTLPEELAAPVEPVVLEAGRYRVFQTPDGGWAVARAVNTCERCQGCGCGDQADPLMVPGWVISLAREGEGRMSLSAFRKLMTRRG
ncbi:MAG: hypothetical protein M0030_04550 [Actinomycetota bacterium]|nr:hypothetical protein [Actinomycetota bacterium]